MDLSLILCFLCCGSLVLLELNALTDSASKLVGFVAGDKFLESGYPVIEVTFICRISFAASTVVFDFLRADVVYSDISCILMDS